MPRIKDLFDGQIRTVNDDVYQQYIQIPSRFQAVRDDETSEPTAIHEDPEKSATNLVGKGLEANIPGFVDVPLYGMRGDGTETPTDTIRMPTSVAESLGKIADSVVVPEPALSPELPPVPPEPASPEVRATET